MGIAADEPEEPVGMSAAPRSTKARDARPVVPRGRSLRELQRADMADFLGVPHLTKAERKAFREPKETRTAERLLVELDELAAAIERRGGR